MVEFHNIETHSRIHTWEGESPIFHLMAEFALGLRQGYQNSGQVTEDEIQLDVADAHTPEIWSVYISTTSVIATRRT